MDLPGYEIFPVQGDGFCILHAVAKGLFHLRGFELEIPDMIELIKTEFSTNSDYYSQFSENDIMKEFEAFTERPLSNYDSDTIDLLLSALGEVLEVNMVVYQSNEIDCWIVDLSKEDNPYPETLYFARTLSLHVDPILPRNSDIQVSTVKSKCPRNH